VNTKNSLYYFINRFVIKVSEGMENIFWGLFKPFRRAAAKEKNCPIGSSNLEYYLSSV
jgi:hypothetical protein